MNLISVEKNLYKSRYYEKTYNIEKCYRIPALGSSKSGKN